MKHLLSSLLALSLLSSAPGASAQSVSASAPGASAQSVSSPATVPGASAPGSSPAALTLEQQVQATLSRMTLEEKTRLSYAQSKFSSPGVPRLGIPELRYSDGPHGVREEINWNNWGHAGWTNDSITAFPALTCLAATWNNDLATLYGECLGEEGRYRGKSVILGPGVNIFRTPLNGRNFEYMGEDPYLTGTMAAPYIQGLQSKGVGCSLKHFCLNNQEEYRGHVNVVVSDRALYEIYLPAFKRAVQQGGAWTVMGSYNQYRDTHASHNEDILDRILKNEWGFQGAVITDWGAAHNTPQAVFNGLDVEMGSYTNGLTTEATGFTYDDYYLGKPYYNLARSGAVSDSIVNDKAARILRLIYHTTLDTSKGFGCLNTQEHLDAARLIAQEGIVLLKNSPLKATRKPLLPLTDDNLRSLTPGRKPRILVVGENATRDLSAGGGSSELKPRTLISPLQGIQERFGTIADISYAQAYASGKPNYGAPDNIPASLSRSLYDEAIAKAKDADLILYIGGLNKNHYEDCEGGDRRYYNMSYNQDQLIADLVRIQPRTAVIIMSGTSIAMPWLSSIPTLVQGWYMGSEAGHALADVLSGDVNPSGKTVFTYAKQLSDYPAHQMGRVGYPGVTPDKLPAAILNMVTRSGNPTDSTNVVPASKDILALGAHISGIDPRNPDINDDIKPNRHNGKGNEVELYNEDILVGYRWFDTKNVPVNFPFGYGMSYTTFQYTSATASARQINPGDTITFTVTVKNTGTRAGKETVQLYIGDDKSSVLRPKKELKSYAKVSLQPGEEKSVTLTISTADLAFFDETTHQWKAEPGTFKAYIAASSADIRHTIPFTLQ